MRPLINHTEMVRDEIKLPDENEEAPKSEQGVGGSIIGCENFSLLDGITKSPPTAR